MMYPEKDLTQQIIGAAIEVHKNLGPGLLESTYQACLEHEFIARNMDYEREQPLMVNYKGILIDCAYRLDFLVENRVIIELKAIDSIAEIHKAQLLTYMKLAKCKIGLLINFNVTILTKGIHRLVL